ncbi:MAG: hypothetical protein HQK54_11515, partial [Oligoflexales bacterium]|nr:hypothetical protein [Oligoflexales bacterium]
MKSIILFLISLLLALIWIVATPKLVYTHGSLENTQIQLNRTKKAIEEFQKKFGRLPENISEIRAYAQTLWKNYSPYDGFGARLHYMPLTDQHYFIKSFGADNSEDTFSSFDDISFLVLPKVGEDPPTYLETENSFMHLYPAVLLMGSKSP